MRNRTVAGNESPPPVVSDTESWDMLAAPATTPYTRSCASSEEECSDDDMATAAAAADCATAVVTAIHGGEAARPSKAGTFETDEEEQRKQRRRSELRATCTASIAESQQSAYIVKVSSVCMTTGDVSTRIESPRPHDVWEACVTFCPPPSKAGTPPLTEFTLLPAALAAFNTLSARLHMRNKQAPLNDGSTFPRICSRLVYSDHLLCDVIQLIARAYVGALYTHSPDYASKHGEKLHTLVECALPFTLHAHVLYVSPPGRVRSASTLPTPMYSHTPSLESSSSSSSSSSRSASWKMALYRALCILPWNTDASSSL